jgi:hypothetical protein
MKISDKLSLWPLDDYTIIMPDGEQRPVDLFENIGDTAEDLRGLEDDVEPTQRAVEEIESMCVACEENVGISKRNLVLTIGNDEIITYENSFLQRGDHNVIFLSSLR